MYTDIHLFQFYSSREASTLQKSNSNLSYLQVSVAWKYLTAERMMLAIAETSLHWSVLYHCLLFKASTNLGKRLSQFTGKSFQLCWNTSRRKPVILLMWTLLCQAIHKSSLIKNPTKSVKLSLQMKHNWTGTHHSIASSSPVPLVAEVLNICHFRSFKAGRPRAFAISVGVMACSMSCLFANTTKMAFFSSSS